MVAECLRRNPLDIVADRQRGGGGVAIDEEITERGKALVDRIAGEFVVVAAFEPNGLDVERLITRDVRVELTSGYSRRKSTDPSYSTDRATSTPSAVMIGPRSTELADQAPRVVDVVLQAFRTEELDPVELQEQHQIQHGGTTPDAGSEVHGAFAGRIKTRCSCDMRTSSASRT